MISPYTRLIYEPNCFWETKWVLVVTKIHTRPCSKATLSGKAYTQNLRLFDYNPVNYSLILSNSYNPLFKKISFYLCFVDLTILATSYVSSSVWVTQ